MAALLLTIVKLYMALPRLSSKSLYVTYHTTTLMGRYGWCCYWARVLASSGHGFVALSFPDGVRTFLITRACGAFSMWWVGHWNNRHSGL